MSVVVSDVLAGVDVGGADDLDEQGLDGRHDPAIDAVTMAAAVDGCRVIAPRSLSM